MAEYEAVAEALRCCAHISKECEVCPYNGKRERNLRGLGGPCTSFLADDALELLNVLEPRVLSTGEMYGLKSTDVWIERRNVKTIHPLYLVEVENTNRSQTALFWPSIKLNMKAYGKTWRCWSARPTDEQREAEPWTE